MKSVVEKVIKDFGDNGEVCVVFRSLNRDKKDDFSIMPDKVLPAASIIKLAILASIMKMVDNKELSFSDQVSIKDGDMFGTFDAQHHFIKASSYTVEDLCRLMIDLSDNLASNMLIRVAGMDRINSDAKANGLKHTVIARKFLDFETQKKGLENYTTPEETVMMIMHFVDKAKAGSRTAEMMLNILANQGDKNYLSQFMPPEICFAHKTGHIPGSMHDVGIITLPSGAEYIISVMTTSLKSDIEGLRFLNTLGEAVFTKITTL